MADVIEVRDVIYVYIVMWPAWVSNANQTHVIARQAGTMSTHSRVAKAGRRSGLTSQTGSAFGESSNNGPVRERPRASAIPDGKSDSPPPRRQMGGWGSPSGDSNQDGGGFGTSHRAPRAGRRAGGSSGAGAGGGGGGGWTTSTSDAPEGKVSSRFAVVSHHCAWVGTPH